MFRLFISTGDRTDRRPVTAPVSGRTGCRHDTPPAERSAAAVTGLRHAEPVVMRRLNCKAALAANSEHILFSDTINFCRNLTVRVLICD